MFRSLRARRAVIVLFLWVGVILLLWWSLKGVNLGEIIAIFGGMKSSQILWLASLNLIIFLLFSARWWIILQARGFSVPFVSTIRYRLTAFSITYFTPGPQLGGEPYQVYMLRKNHNLTLVNALSSVTLDKLLEMLSNFTFLVLGIGIIFQNDQFSASLRSAALPIAIGLLCLPLGHTLLLWFGRTPIASVLRFLSEVIPQSPMLGRIYQIVNSSEREISSFTRSQPRILITLVILSAITWVLLIIEFGLALRFLGLTLSLPYVIGVMTATRLAFLLPMPSGLGALEASLVIAMDSLGVDSAIGISMGLLIRARDVTIGAIGLIIGRFWSPIKVHNALRIFRRRGALPEVE